MRRMGDPDYVYRPWTNERRERARTSALRRLGTPPGYRIVFGMPVPLAIWMEVRDAACKFHYHRDGTVEPLWKTRAFVIILAQLLEKN